MNYIPSLQLDPGHVCRVFQKLARRTWRDLRDSHQHHLSLSEESITDYRLLEMKRELGKIIEIEKFTRTEEGQNGADWEWWILGAVNAFGMRIQAKRLYLDSMRYMAMRPPHGPTQASKLIQDALTHNLYPLYCFYNYYNYP